MPWFKIIALVSLIVCLFIFSYHLARLIRLKKPMDYAPSSGNTRLGIQYSLTGAMNPRKKESAFLHLPTYTAGILYHLGTFLSIPLFFLLLLQFQIPSFPASVFAVFFLVTAACGTGILIKRIIKRELRSLSSPDDYVSNILVTLFQVFSCFILLFPSVAPGYYVVASALLLYLPAGKLKHALYFFAARYHLGLFYGWRGVWPPKTL